MSNVTVSQTHPDRWRARDLVLHGLGSQGRAVSLVWSELTGEVFTVVKEQQHVLVQVYGRTDTYTQAAAVRDQCPVDPTGLTLLEAAERALTTQNK
jgi:hypothetical protein